MLPKHSTLVAPRRTSLTIAEAAALPLILPTSTHGLRRRIAAEFEQRSLSARIVAEIDSLSLLMNCVYDGMGATIKPMAAVYLERDARPAVARALDLRCAPDAAQLPLLAGARAAVHRRGGGRRRAEGDRASPRRVGRLVGRRDHRRGAAVAPGRCGRQATRRPAARRAPDARRRVRCRQRFAARDANRPYTLATLRW